MRRSVPSALLLSFTAVALAADPSGVWKIQYRMPDGTPHESTLNLQLKDGKLTGGMESRRGKVPISEAAISGDDVSFTVVRVGNGDELKIEFRGKCEGDTMKLRMQYRDHGPIEMTAKRAS